MKTRDCDRRRNSAKKRRFPESILFDRVFLPILLIYTLPDDSDIIIVN